MTKKPIDKSLFDKAVSFARAMAFGRTDVTPEQIQKRIEICAECPFVELKNGKTPSCSICGCSLGPSDKSLRNLARFKEVDGKTGWGCYKHYDTHKSLPERSEWARNGV